MHANGKNPDGFTLIELAIVIAIVAILAAIALPDFIRMQIVAKRAEGIMLLENIRISETTYFLDNETYAQNPINAKLGVYGILPSSTQLKFYQNRNCNSQDAHYGYRCFVIAYNLDKDLTPDILVLKIGYSGPAGNAFPEGISISVDDSIL